MTIDWEYLIKEESKKDYYINLMEYIDKEYCEKDIYPAKENIFAALERTKLSDVKVVILGQDPYHGEGEAHGLAFSVNEGIKVPPSLKNIYKELKRDLNINIDTTSGYLGKWAAEGVLLLNSVLTVEKDNPGSHRKKGWEIFTDKVIENINKKDEPVVFMLWGNYAKEKEKLITNPKHLILKSTHPSPFSFRNGFDGCSHFSTANKFLNENNRGEINWKI